MTALASDPSQYPIAKAIDAVAAGAIVGSFLGWLPVIASVVSIIWFVIQITESHTFVTWHNNWKTRSREKKLARLRAKEKVLVAEIHATETIRAAHADAQELLATAKMTAIMDIVHGDKGGDPP